MNTKYCRRRSLYISDDSNNLNSSENLDKPSEKLDKSSEILDRPSDNLDKPSEKLDRPSDNIQYDWDVYKISTLAVPYGWETVFTKSIDELLVISNNLNKDKITRGDFVPE